MSDKKVNIETVRHSLSHVLAMAVLEMFPEAKLGIGPAIDNGFYYDFDLPRTLIPEDLPILEEKMRKIIEKNIKIEKHEKTKKEAIEFIKKTNQPYKAELVEELEDEKAGFYTIDGFIDLCKGPHVASTGELKDIGFKLHKIAGAYWRGSEKNKMLQRIYGLAFETPEDLKKYEEVLIEAEKRDHRKLGKELDLFVFSDLVGPGLPLFTPKGTFIRETLQKKVEDICRKYGFQKVSTPHLAKIDLYKISGHADKFGDELFHVTSAKDHDFVLKPVQCPHQTQIYASRQRSYKDLPISYMESEKQYRAEKSGEVGGLNRVYAITCEDGHTFCTPSQVKDQIKNLVNIIKDFYSSLGMWDNHWVSLSVRDYSHPEKYIGDTKDWDLCEKTLQEISDEMGLEAKRCEGEAALYGPKLDFMFKDATGREIQIPTIQLDFATPKRFNLTYINEGGEAASPVMIHRAILGSYERFMALLIEHFAGAFPVWLAPVQAVIIPISEKQLEYAKKVEKELLEKNIRVEVDERNESMGKKIRESEMQKIPYMLIVGDKEKEANKVAVRKYGEGDKGLMSTEDIVKGII
ncbi:MAG: threonine--tRNA ligase [Patescibacteria group bacterium]